MFNITHTHTSSPDSTEMSEMEYRMTIPWILTDVSNKSQVRGQKLSIILLKRKCIGLPRIPSEQFMYLQLNLSEN